jgi:regulator of sirC expression with transglutaminase-like and TPR domain
MKGPGMNIPEARRRFAALVDRDQEGFRLAEAALLIAQEEYANLDVTAYLARIDSIADTIKAQLALELDPMRIVQGINTHLFDALGFRGNREHYADPRNSFLNDVIERRLGIPITLSVVYIEIGRLVGLPIAGVGMPGHFIVQYTAQPEPFWIDPFHHGNVMTRADCQQFLQRLYGEKLPWNDAFLDPVSDHDILQRMLNNLKIIYARQGEHRRALSVIERILVLSPDLPYEVRDRGLVHYQLGHLQAALYDLQRYLVLFQEAPDADVITRHIDALRQQLEP